MQLSLIGLFLAGIVIVAVGVIQVSLAPRLGVWSISVPLAVSLMAAAMWIPEAYHYRSENIKAFIRASAVGNGAVGILLLLAMAAM